MKDKNRVLVIGLDGARLDVIEKWIKEGSLPNIKRMMKKGAYGNLRTVFPPHSMLAWASFMTGKNPGKHGIYNIQLQIPGTYKLIVPNSTNMHSKTLFEILSEDGKTVGSINMPLTFPIRKVNGVVVSSWLTPPMTKFAHPKTAYEELKKIGYKIQPSNLHKEDKNFIEEVYETEERRIEAVKWFMKSHDWDFVAVLITGTEHMHHNYAAFIDKKHPDYRPEYEEVVKKYYSYVDKKIGELLKVVGKNTVVFIISDHGFGPSYGEIYLNNLLRKYGYFKERKKFNLIRFLFERMESSGMANKLRNKLRISYLNIPKSIQNLIKEKRAEYVQADWKLTKAYCTGILGDIRINLIGREPEGIISSEKYEKLRSEIIEKILKDKDVGKFVKNVLKREEIFHGPHLEEISDLYVEFKGCCTSSVKIPNGNMVGKRRDTGFHTMDGVFIAYGPNIEQRGGMDNAKIIDLAPTILYLFGLPVPDSMDGDVLINIFKRKAKTGKRKKKYRDKSMKRKKREKKRKFVMSKKDEEKVKERLRALGYI